MPPENAERRPLTTTDAPETNSPSTTIPDPAEVAALIAERREAWQAGVLDGYAAGWQDGLRAGAERGTAA